MRLPSEASAKRSSAKRSNGSFATVPGYARMRRAAVNREQVGLPEGHALQSHALMLLQEHLRRQRVDVARLHTAGVKRHGGQCRGKQNAGGASRQEAWRAHAVSRLVM